MKRVLALTVSASLAQAAFAQAPAPAAPAAVPAAAPAVVPAVPAALTAAAPATGPAPASIPATPAAPVTVAQVTPPAADRAAVPAATPALPGAPELAVQPTTAPALPQAVLAAVNNRPLPTLVPFTAPAKPSAQARAKARRARLAKRAAKKRRGPASIEEDSLQIYDEKTSFESLVLNRQATARNPAAFQPQARIIAVRRELALTADDAAAVPQDIVLNAGTENGLDEGMVLSVARSVPILDPYRENQQKQLEIEFAKVRVIHAQPNLAIARLDKIDSIRKGLAVGTRAVLIGDYVGKFSK